MKHLFPIIKKTLSVSLIVLLLGAEVNRADHGKIGSGNTQVADGAPLPPPTQPPPKLGSVQVADGAPLPPPTQPPPKLRTVLVADGAPLPPPTQPPPKLHNA